MSYSARVDGKILIHPPLKVEEYANTSLHEVGLNYNKDLKLHIVEHTETNADGDTVYSRRAVGLIAVSNDSFSFYHVEDEVNEFARQFAGGHSFTGHLMRVGEEQGDVKRFTITDDGQVVTEHARLVWVDGSDVEGAGL